MATDYYKELAKDPEFESLKPEDKLSYGRWWAEQQGIDQEEVVSAIQTPPTVYQQFERHDPDFATLSPSDQLAYARWLVDQKNLPAEEHAEMLSAVQKGILRGQTGDVEYSALESAAGGLVLGLQKTAEDVSAGAKWYKKAFDHKAARFASQPLEATAKEIGWDAADLATYTIGLIPQGAITLGELPLVVGQALGNQWAGEHVAKLEELKKSYDTLQIPGSQYGVDIALAVGTAGLSEAAIATYRGLKAGALAEQLASASTLSKTLAATKAATIGEITFVTPATQVALNAVDESGYDEDTKSILRLVAPFALGITSAATVEAKALKMLQPEAVAAAKKAFVAGKSAEEAASEMSRVVKSPDLFSSTAEETSGSVRKASEGVSPLFGSEIKISGIRSDRLQIEWKPEELPPSAIKMLGEKKPEAPIPELPPGSVKMVGRRGVETPLEEPPGFEIIQPRSENLRPVEEDWLSAVSREKPRKLPETSVVPEAEAPIIQTGARTPETALQNAWLRYANELPAVKSETARLLAEAEAPLARARARKAGLRPRAVERLPEQLSDLTSYDNVLEAARPAVEAAKKVRVALISGRVNFADFAEAHGVLLEKLAKYNGTEGFIEALRIPENATELTSLHTDRLLALSYNIPGTNNWTVQAFDDMLEAARHAEALHAKVSKVRNPLTSELSEVVEQTDQWLGVPRNRDSAFVKKVLGFLKTDQKLFRLLPVKEFPGRPGARGGYEFTQNLLMFKDARALPHEIGHWGFFNALDGSERLQYLTMLRDRLKTGWQPGEKLVRGEATYPDGSGTLRANSGLNPSEYFAEQFAQFFYTRRADNALMEELCQANASWSERLLRGMKNENLLDQDLEPFFARFAEVSKLETLHHPELGQLLGTTETLTDALVQARSLAKRLGGAATLSGESFDAVIKEFGQALQNKISNGSLKLDDARRFFTLSTKRFRELLFDPRQSEVLRTMRDLGLTAQENPALLRQASEILTNEAGAITPMMLRQIALHTVPLVAGFESDGEELRWNAAKALKIGGAWYGFLYGGKALAKTGLPLKIIGKSRSLNNRFFEMMTAPAETKLGKVRRAVGLFGTAFRQTEGIDPEIWSLKRQFMSRWREIDRELSAFSDHLRENFSPEERKMISDVIEQEGNFEKASEAVREQAREVQTFLRGVREQLIASGVDPKILQKHGDQWLHRVYMPKLLEHPRLAFRQKRLRALGQSYLKARGEKINLTQAKFQLDSAGFAPAEKGFSFTDRLGRRRWALESQTERVAAMRELFGEPELEWTIKKDPRGKITASRNYSRTERTAMGENRDAALRLADFFRESSHDMALGEMFQQVLERHSLEPPKGLSAHELDAWGKENGVTKMPDTFTTKSLARYGVLNGKWVKEDVKRVLERSTSNRYESELWEGISYAYRKLHSFWKAGKTAFTPAGHITNLLTNNAMVAIADYPVDLVNLNGFKAMAKGEGSQVYREALAAGWAPHALAHTEFDVSLFEKELVNDEQSTLLKAFHKAISISKAGAKLPLKIYSFHDDVVKLGIFAHERAAGKSAKEALAAAERIIPDYTDLPRGVQILRDTAIMPFVSWTYKVIPTVARSIVTNPEKYIGIAIALKLLDDHAYEQEFGERAEAQRELEKAVKDRGEGEKSFFGLGPSADVRLASDGNVARFLGSQKYIPGADLFQSTFESFPFGMSPIITSAYAWGSGKNPWKGLKIRKYDEPLTKAEEEANFEAYQQFLTNTWLPNVPGIPLTWASEKLGNALVATGDISEGGPLWDYAQERGWTGKDYFGNDVSLGDTLLQLGGIPIQRVDIAGAGQIKLLKATGRLTSATKILTKEALSTKSTPARRARAEEQYRQQVEQASEEAQRIQELFQNAQ